MSDTSHYRGLPGDRFSAGSKCQLTERLIKFANQM